MSKKITSRDGRQHKPASDRPVTALIKKELEPLSYRELAQVCHGIICSLNGEVWVVEELPDNLRDIADRVRVSIPSNKIGLLAKYLEKRGKQETKGVRKVSFLGGARKRLTEDVPSTSKRLSGQIKRTGMKSHK